MIAPLTPRDHRLPGEGPRENAERGRLVEFCREFFRVGGFLERACAGEAFPFEPRVQQLQMAEAVAGAVAEKAHLAVEAGTGVGKSFAYLVPLIRWAVTNQAQAVVSTYTIALQEQLISKDIPFLQKHMGIDFRAVLVKGRGNYVCLRRLARAQEMQQDLFEKGHLAELRAIREWCKKTPDGSLQSMETQPSAVVWDAVCCEHGNCLYRKCPEYHACFLMRAREAIRTANLLVVNHHLLFSELGMRARGGAFLPAYRVVVLDEAHVIEDVATEHLGIRLSRYMFEHWLRRLFVPDKNKGLFARLHEGRGQKVATKLWSDVEDFFDAVADWAKFKSAEDTHRLVSEPLPIRTSLLGTLKEMRAILTVLADNPEYGPDIKGELKSVAMRGQALHDELKCFLERSLDDQVYWVEREGTRGTQHVLYSAPIEVAPILREVLFGKLDSVIMTSATLSVGGTLDYFTERVGAAACRGVRLGSPFDYARQMRVYIARGLPDPNDDEKFAPAAARATVRFIRKTHGNAFVLFTSARLLRRVADLAAADIDKLGLLLLVQGKSLSRHQMLERFRRGDGCVLFGLDSFWMGVDVRGPALSNVIITRLPFAVPDHPVIEARMERIRERGGDPFREYSLPEAVLRFRQGVGRLIRTQADEGMVVVLDSRVLTRWYGRIFLESIPDCPREIVEFTEAGEEVV